MDKQHVTSTKNLKDKVKENPNLKLTVLLDQAESLACKTYDELFNLLQQDLNRFDQALEQIKIGDCNPKLMKRLYNIANDIGVNSENIGRKLLVGVTDSLCELLENRDTIQNNKEYEILIAHFNALHVILKQDETLAGTDEMAALLVASLRQSVLAL